LLRDQGHMLPQSSLAEVVNAVSDAVVGMELIEFLLKDRDVTEVTHARRPARTAAYGVGPSCIACMFFIMTASAVRSSSLGLNDTNSVPGSFCTGTWPGGV
jgi:hypothetical protein